MFERVNNSSVRNGPRKIPKPSAKSLFLGFTSRLYQLNIRETESVCEMKKCKYLIPLILMNSPLSLSALWCLGRDPTVASGACDKARTFSVHVHLTAISRTSSINVPRLLLAALISRRPNRSVPPVPVTMTVILVHTPALAAVWDDS
jgi:hypothetical protein